MPLAQPRAVLWQLSRSIVVLPMVALWQLACRKTSLLLWLQGIDLLLVETSVVCEMLSKEPLVPNVVIPGGTYPLPSVALQQLMRTAGHATDERGPTD